MKLKEKSFPLQFSLDETTNFIKQTLKEKNWSDFEVIEVKIVFIPFYFFSYDAFYEEKENKIVSETVHGQNALNGRTTELDETISFPIETELIQEIKELPDNIPFQELNFEFNEKIELIAQIKIAAQLKTSKDNVIIHSLKKVLFPVWIIDFSVGNQTFQFQISGVNGSIISEQEIPERQLGFWEVTAETLNELKSPSNWIHYTTSIVSDSANFITKNTFSGNLIQTFLSNARYQIFILLIILALILLWNYGFI